MKKTKSTPAQLLINISIAILIPLMILVTLEWTVKTFAPKRSKTYFDDQTEHWLGKPVPKKSPGEYRIFIFGGSSAYGFPVADRYSIAAWMNKSFAALLPNHKIRTVNAAWPGKASYHDLEGALNTLKYKPDLFIIYTGHNEANIDNRLFKDNVLYRLNLMMRFRSSLYNFLTYRFHRIRKFLIYGSEGYVEKQYREEIIANKVYRHVEVDDDEYDEIMKGFRRNIESLVKAAKKHRVGVMIMNPPSNLREIPPAISLHRPGLTTAQREAWNKVWEESKKLFDEKKYAEAIPFLSAAVAMDLQYAEAQYRLGQAFEKTGEYQKAKVAYESARDHDGRPLRAKTSLSQILKNIADTYGLMWLDMIEVFEKLSPHGIIGSSLIYDNVHPSVQAQQIMTDQILQLLMAQHKIAPAAEWQWDKLKAARTDPNSAEWKIEGNVNGYEFILRGIHLWEQQRYSDAAKDLMQGLQVMPDFLESYAFLGDSYLHMGDKAKALAAFQTLLQKDSHLSEYLFHKYPDIEKSYRQTIAA